MAMFDKLKAMKALNDPETREKLKAAIILQAKSLKAQQATAMCIAEGLGEPKEITSLEISAGENGFLPLSAIVCADGEEKAVESVQPEEADFDYKLLCEDFNDLIAEKEDAKAEFLQKTAELLNAIIAENGVANETFCTKIR